MLSSWNLAQSLQECLIVAHKPELRRHAQTQIFDRICSSCAKFPNMFNSCAQKQSHWETMIGVENTSPNYEFVHTLNTGISPWVLPGSGPWHHVGRITAKVLAQDFIKLLILARSHLLGQGHVFGRKYDVGAKFRENVWRMHKKNISCHAQSFLKCLIVAHTVLMDVEFLRKVSKNVQFMRTKTQFWRCQGHGWESVAKIIFLHFSMFAWF